MVEFMIQLNQNLNSFLFDSNYVRNCYLIALLYTKMKDNIIQIILPKSFKITIQTSSPIVSQQQIIAHLRHLQLIKQKYTIFNSQSQPVQQCQDRQTYLLSTSDTISYPSNYLNTHTKPSHDNQPDKNQLTIQQKQTSENQQLQTHQADQSLSDINEKRMKKFKGVAKSISLLQKAKRAAHQKQQKIEKEEIKEPLTDPIHKKTALNIMKLIGNVDGTERVCIKFYLQNQLIGEEMMKKMSIISHPIMQKYDLYTDSECTKAVKKKTIALGDRNFYCRSKQQSLVQISEIKQNPEQINEQDKVQITQNCSSKNIFRVIKKKHLKKDEPNQVQNSQEESIKKSKSSIFKVKKTLVTDLLNHKLDLLKVYKPQAKK